MIFITTPIKFQLFYNNMGLASYTQGIAGSQVGYHNHLPASIITYVYAQYRSRTDWKKIKFAWATRSSQPIMETQKNVWEHEGSCCNVDLITHISHMVASPICSIQVRHRNGPWPWTLTVNQRTVVAWMIAHSPTARHAVTGSISHCCRCEKLTKVLRLAQPKLGTRKWT